MLNLGNAYEEYCRAPKKAREQVLQRWVRCSFVAEKGPPEDFDHVHPDLLPSVRMRSYFEFARLQMELAGPANASWPHAIVAEHLAVSLVYDLPEAMRSIIQEDLDNWGATFYEALEVARENLSQLQFAFVGPEEGEGVYMSATRDNYDATRMILLDVIGQLNVKGDPVAMIPNRDTLIVTGADDPDGLKGMVKLAEHA